MNKKDKATPKQQPRRNALKIARNSALVAAAATQLPNEWQKPAIDSVILPAHAATTDDSGDLGTGVTTTTQVTTTPQLTTTVQVTTTQMAGSDIRLKTEIEPLAKAPNGMQLYRFQYKNDLLKKNHVGVMAQDLVTTHPHALVKNSDGYFMVRYDLLGLKMTSLEAWEQQGMDSVLLH